MAGNRKWRFSFWPVAAFVVMLPVLVSLGVWQVQRGIGKQALYDEYHRAGARAAEDVSALALNELDELADWTRVRLHGRYLNQRTFLLDNMSSAGRPGHHVLTPFLPEGEPYAVVVDRGWRAGLARNAQAREVPRATADEVQGRLAPFPRPGLALKGKPEASGPWPRTVQFPDADELSRQLDRSVASRRLLLDAEAAEGFEREWEPPGLPPARHFAYAFQWFALALALVVIFFVMARPRREETGD